MALTILTNNKTEELCQSEQDGECWIPSSALVFSIVRKGELLLSKLGSCQDTQDDQLICSISELSCREEVEALCEASVVSPPLLARHWTRSSPGVEEPERELIVLQWNMLSQALGTTIDNFVSAGASLHWEERRWRVIQEIVRHSPDVICLQEVDHFRLVERMLTSLGYKGQFVPKPDSPCLYVEDNNGPDGCALFYRADKFDCDRVESTVLSVWGVPSNQVVLAASLTHYNTGRRLVVATTHLKARSGTLNVMMRAEQGRNLLEWVDTIRQDAPVILAGDFNAGPEEPLLDLLTTSPALPLQTSYSLQDTQFTSCKLRQSGREVKLLDYILHSPGLETVSTLDIPLETEIGPLLLPSHLFPSDHLSLAAHIRL